VVCGVLDGHKVQFQAAEKKYQLRPEGARKAGNYINASVVHGSEIETEAANQGHIP